MALSIKQLAAPEQPQRNAGGRPNFVPTQQHRQLVEVLVAVGASNEAICRELVELGVPCASRETLRKAFAFELEHGKERRVLRYGVRMHTIAMSDSPQALPALRYLLGVLGGPEWRLAKEDPEDVIAPNASDGTVHIYMPPNHRDEPEADEADDGPMIEGKAEAA